MRTQEAGTLVSASDLVYVSDYFSFVGADSQRPVLPSRPESDSGIGCWRASP